MPGPKFLIDTNIVIGLEDNHLVKEVLVRFLTKAHEHGGRLFVHEANRADVLRDKNEDRKRITLSKLGKFERLSRIALPTVQQLEAYFGTIKNEHDRSDVELLYALNPRQDN